MELTPIFLAYLLVSYLLGAIPFGYVIGKIFGKDITKEGSGNIGATNVTRTIGKKAGILVLVLDMLKGFLPVWYAQKIFWNDYQIALIAMSPIIGHCFSIFMKFKGGKGVATGVGIILALSTKTATIVLMLWLGAFLVSGYVSLASILSASFAWVIYIFIEKNTIIAGAILISSIIIFFKHSSNIERLIKGTEHKFLHKD